MLQQELVRRDRKMAYKTEIKTVINAATADTSTVQDVGHYDKVTLVSVYTRTGSSEGTLTVKGAVDSAGAKTYLLDMATEAGTRDADGAIAYTTSADTVLVINPNQTNRYISIDWNETVDGASETVYLIGRYWE